MRKVVAITLLLTFGCLSAYAQTTDSQASSGSVYSKIGIGLPTDPGSSGAAGMGLRGVSFAEPFVPGFANPAHWGSTVYGMATGGVSLKGYHASDFQGSSSNVLFTPDYFQFQLPILRNELGISISMVPLTRSTFRQVQIGTEISGSGSAQDTLIYQSQIQGGGGINMLEMGAGWNINSNISIGYAGSLVFASLDNEYSTVFASNEYNSVRYNLQTSGIGFGNRFGLQLNIPGILSENDQISLGASVMLPVRLNAERVEETDKTLSDGSTRTVVTTEGDNLGDGTIKLPAEITAGLTYHASRLLSISTEGLYQNWSDFRYDFNPDAEQMMTNRYKIGLGFRYFPYISGSDKFLSGFKYRLGATYDMGYLNIDGQPDGTINRQRIETLMFSFGLGILSPRSNSNSSIDISFEYGIRGTKDQNLVKEDIWGLSLSLNLAELFFYRPKLQ